LKNIFLKLPIMMMIISACATIPKSDQPSKMAFRTPLEKKLYERAEKGLERLKILHKPYLISPYTALDSVRIQEGTKEAILYFNHYLSYRTYRPGQPEEFESAMKAKLGWRFRKYELEARTLNLPLKAMVPNYFQEDEEIDHSRMPIAQSKIDTPFISPLDRPYTPYKGLDGKNIALWNSHGWYFNVRSLRWEWERPRLFQTVEDLLPTSFVLPYLLPMLENAGAITFLPRERDIQNNMVIVDNDSCGDYREFSKTTVWQTGADSGFAVGNPPYDDNLNPFAQGSWRWTESDSIESAYAEWIPDIPETGDYAVYLSWRMLPEAATDALYTVYYNGDSARFQINQQRGGGTWVYIGTFPFLKGKNPAAGSVKLSNRSLRPGAKITADAVRFGGGMGDVSRNGIVSGRPRFMEAARYYLQFAGMPDTLVYHLHENKNDYNDDYMSRGEWVNYLNGSPNGPNKVKNHQGLNIPIELSLAFHTDAGITPNESVIGTLSIYSIVGMDSTNHFPDGMSRLANRDLADLMHTQIVNDLRILWNPMWNQRDLRHGRYHEAMRPNAPSALLELLSHQNFSDMRYALDPRFRFDVSRAIYKSMLRFIAQQHQQDYIVQPLPVSHFQSELLPDGRIRLAWQATEDPLESSASPHSFIVYTRRENQGFNQGQITQNNSIILDAPEPDIIYSFKVTALNDGGESFPSEILSLCRTENHTNPVLIINAFDRISGPAYVESEAFRGFLGLHDEGVPDGYDLGYVGQQFDFAVKSPFVTNDAPGHGASFADEECTVIPGNTFDFPYIHGKAIRNAGYSFVSVSDEAVENSDIALNHYKVIDFIAGEEKRSPTRYRGTDPLPDSRYEIFSPLMQKKLSSYLKNGGNIFLSGAYLASDPFLNSEKESPEQQFVREWLKYDLVAHHANRTGETYSTGAAIFSERGITFRFNSQRDPKIYTVEAPDALRPLGENSEVFLRYGDNHYSAGVMYQGKQRVVAVGFPFETIVEPRDRDLLMAQILSFFLPK
jgi:hypothetical protein